MDVIRLKTAAITVIEYLLGFMALAIFVAYAYAHGTPTVARWEQAFKLGAILAALEIAILYARKPPMNRLILGGNIWLLVGGLAFVFGQEKFLRMYESMGEASVFAAILCVGIIATLYSKNGFVGVQASRNKVLTYSAYLLIATATAFVTAIVFKGNIKIAGVLPLTALAFFHRYLRHVLRNSA